MTLFKVQNNKVKKLVVKELSREKNLQSLFEENLEEILNITFLASEYPTSFGGRIDTLGIDKTGAPVIIEYKKSQNDNVINQGLSYLRWLLDHKANFEILCQSKNIKIGVDWSSPRVICIAESYNKFDLDTADILPINVELLRYRIHEDNILYLEPETYQKVKVSTAGIIKKSKQQKFKKKLQQTYSIDNHLKRADERVKRIFLRLRELITSLDKNIIEEPKAKYIAYKLNTNFTDIEIWKRRLKVYLNLKSGQLKDPYNIAKDLTKPKLIGHWGNGDYRILLEKEEDVEKVFEIIKQSYDFNK